MELINTSPGQYLTKDDLKIIQPNQVTNARYNFSEIEENILIHIISALQDFMTKDYPIQCDLFGEPCINIDLAKTKYHNIEKRLYIRALKKFIKKTISFDWRNAQNKATNTTATFITAFHNVRGTTLVQVTLNKWAIPYLIYWGKGHTRYHKGIALSLPGSHTKRLYTLIKQWCNNRENYGEYSISIDALKKQFGLEKKYSKVSDFERYVIIPAQEKIKKHADFYFNYRFYKAEGSRAFTHISFLIHGNNTNLPQPEKTDMYRIVYHVIGWAFSPQESTKCQEFTDYLAQNPDEFYKVYSRLKKEYECYMSGEKQLRDIIPLVKFILREDYNLF